jgi:hypothetical protein
MIWWIILCLSPFVLVPAFSICFDRVARKRNVAVFAYLTQQLDANPADRDADLKFLSSITGMKLPVDQIIVAIKKSLSILKRRLGDRDVHRAFVDYLKSDSKIGSMNAHREAAYRSVLSMLAINSDASVRAFVLDLARWHYALARKDGNLTIYDEQAIQNDILMHSKSVG